MKKKEEQLESFYGHLNGGNLDTAFHLLVDLYQEQLYHIVRRIVLDHDNAMDVLQDAFIKIWKNLPEFRSDSQIYTWIYRIAVNESLSFLRKEKRRMTDALEHEPGIPSGPHYDGDDIMTALYAAMEKLPEKQKLVFQMRYFDDMPYEDISKVLNTSVGGLKANYHHAVNKIKEEIERIKPNGIFDITSI